MKILGLPQNSLWNVRKREEKGLTFTTLNCHLRLCSTYTFPFVCSVHKPFSCVLMLLLLVISIWMNAARSILISSRLVLLLTFCLLVRYFNKQLPIASHGARKKKNFVWLEFVIYSNSRCMIACKKWASQHLLGSVKKVCCLSFKLTFHTALCYDNIFHYFPFECLYWHNQFFFGQHIPLLRGNITKYWNVSGYDIP